MDWRAVLVFVVAGLVVIVFIILGILLQRARRMSAEWRSRCLDMEDVALRLINERENRGLSNENAIKKLEGMLNNWDPCDPPGMPDRGRPVQD